MRRPRISMTVLRSRRLWVALLVVALLAVVLLALFARAMIPSGSSRPSNPVRPELVGMIDGSERSGAVLRLSFDGHQLELDTTRSTHLFGPAVNEGVLLWYGESEEGPWYATAAPLPDEPECFTVRSSPFYAPGEPPFYGDEGEIVVVGHRELGVVLPKASNFDAAGSRPDLETGVYQLGYWVACANERGEVTGFRP